MISNARSAFSLFLLYRMSPTPKSGPLIPDQSSWRLIYAKRLGNSDGQTARLCGAGAKECDVKTASKGLSSFRALMSKNQVKAVISLDLRASQYSNMRSTTVILSSLGAAVFAGVVVAELSYRRDRRRRRLAIQSAVDSRLALIRRLPKCELHAHLHGSIHPRTLLRLARDRLSASAYRRARVILDRSSDTRKEDRSLSECFEVFDIIHQCVTDAHSLQLITREVLEMFAADGVRYLELRSTPRAPPEGTSKRYVLYPPPPPP